MNRVAQTLKDRLSVDAAADSHSVQTGETVKVYTIIICIILGAYESPEAHMLLKIYIPVCNNLPCSRIIITKNSEYFRRE